MFSQNSEDEIMAACFHEDFQGAILEIGSWEAINLSNSRMFIQKGWSAVLCEFSPIPLSKLVREYADNPRVQVIAAAITSEEGHVEKFRITDDALSGNNPEHLKLWEKDGGFYGDLWVPTLSLRALLDQFWGDRAFNIASIDVEGASVPLAIALMRSGHSPEVICCEHNGRSVEFMEVAQAKGYHMIHLNQENLIARRA